jgi:hypothetical protein
MAMLGAIEQQVGNRAEARRLQLEASRRAAAMPEGHPAHGHLRALLLAVSARLAADDGDQATARGNARDALAAAVGTRDMPIVATVGVILAELVADEDPEVAAGMLGAAAALRGSDDATARDIATLTERLRGALGAARFADYYGRGKALERDAAIERLTVG